MSFKTPSESETIMTEIIFPNDTNPMGIVQGGRVVQLMDIASAVCAQVHTGRIAVTASIDRVQFKHPARLGDVLTIKARITRVFNTSMEIYAEVTAKRLPEMKPLLTHRAYFTFVALDERKSLLQFRLLSHIPQKIKYGTGKLSPGKRKKMQNNINGE